MLGLGLVLGLGLGLGYGLGLVYGFGLGEGIANGYVISFWGDENVLKLIVVMVVKLCEYTKTIELHTLKWVTCM